MVYVITFTVQDDKGRKGRSKFYMPDTATLPEVIAYSQDNLQVIDPLIYGAFVNASITFDLDIRGLGLKAVPHPLADVEEKMAIRYSKVSGRSFGISLPAFNDEFSTPVVRSNYRVLDFLQAEAEALTNLHLNPVANGHPRGISDNRGEQANALKSTRQKWFSSGRRK